MLRGLPLPLDSESRNTTLLQKHHTRKNSSTAYNMPLVVPGITDNSNSKDLTQEWMNKLLGKIVSDNSHSETNFCKKDLPQRHRVIQPGMMVTKDFVPDRLNVHVKEDGTVSHVAHG
ncbi:hypothetical protein F5Y14DRAFT_432130 [Nemania sp. NC0429]|nr:hypothetical protein F5Y14DRAFT_432130 [Nemania sp. NC0429]